MPKLPPHIVALAVVVALVAVAASVLLLTGGDDDAPPRKVAPTAGARVLEVDGAFRLTYPTTWEPIDRGELGVVDGVPLGAIRRRDNSAQMIVQRGPRLTEPLARVAADLEKRLKGQLKDFRLVKSGEVKLPAGDALSFAFVRTTSGQVQNLTVIPKGGRTFTLNSVVSGRATDARREIAAIVRSFAPQD
jgi:hypothetical protein